MSEHTWDKGTTFDQHLALDQQLAEERVLRAEAERISGLKDEFLATLGHELQSPLHAILGWSRLLQSGRLSPEDVQRGGRTIDRNVRALAQMVDDLIDMSGLINGRVRLDPEETDLAQITEAALENVQAPAEAKGVLLLKQVPDQACLVFGDRQRLQQVIANLLGNAIKYTPRGGTISTTLARVNGSWEIRVADTGPGLSAKALSLVFDRFRLADSSVKRNAPGLGLGLVIVKQVVELHGGKVWAISEGEGHGSTFCVQLPRLAPHEPAAAAAALAPADLRGLRVLLVDYDREALESVRQVLSGARALVATATSATAALDALTSFRADVLVAELALPQRDGYDLIRTIRTRLTPSELPAVALTDFSRPQDAVRAHDAGFQMHLAKPADPEELVRAVAQLGVRN